MQILVNLDSKLYKQLGVASPVTEEQKFLKPKNTIFFQILHPMQVYKR